MTGHSARAAIHEVTYKTKLYASGRVCKPYQNQTSAATCIQASQHVHGVDLQNACDFPQPMPIDTFHTIAGFFALEERRDPHAMPLGRMNILLSRTHDPRQSPPQAQDPHGQHNLSHGDPIITAIVVYRVQHTPEHVGAPVYPQACQQRLCTSRDSRKFRHAG